MACVTKRWMLGGTMSESDRLARDVMLGLMKTCQSSASPSSLISAIGSASTGPPSVSLRYPICWARNRRKLTSPRNLPHLPPTYPVTAIWDRMLL